MRRFVWVGLTLAGCGVSGEEDAPRGVDTATLTTPTGTGAVGTEDTSPTGTAPTGTAPAEDLDQDGVSEAEGDCADDDESIYPGAVDVVGDAVDANCDGHDGVDADQDGFADLASGGDDCEDWDPSVTGATDGDLDGATLCGGDCDDAEALAAPGLVEECDAIDNDCGGDGDEAAGVHTCETQDRFSNATAVDILFVVDNSCSMADEQGRASAATSTLLSQIGDLDFHLGLITTDMDNANESGRLMNLDGLRWIDGATPDSDAEAWLAELIDLGTGGSGDERGLDAVQAAFTAVATMGTNAGFERADASLFVVVVADEGDFSNATPATFLPWFSAYKAAPAVARVHSLVSPNPVCPGASTPGTRYESVSTSTGGLIGSVCDADYAPFMEQVADDIVATADTGLLLYPLTEVADPSTITVLATAPDGTVTVLTPADWVYDAVANTIEILGVWTLGTTFTVDYLRVP